MIVVSDTGPLRYLIEVDCIDVLPRLYSTVLTTPQVLAELRLKHFPEAVRQWVERPPSWLEVKAPNSVAFLGLLDDGEASALSLAGECAADIVLIDERAASDVARSMGLRSIGTLAVLFEAGLDGLIDFYVAIDRLTTRTKFRHSPQLIAHVIADYQRARQQGVSRHTEDRRDDWRTT